MPLSQIAAHPARSRSMLRDPGSVTVITLPVTVITASPTVIRRSPLPGSSWVRVSGYGSSNCRRSSSRNVGRDVRVGGEQLLGLVDAGEHERRVDAGAVGAEDVGVQPVAEEERLCSAERGMTASS